MNERPEITSHAPPAPGAGGQGRFETIDVLRGAALMAILMAHCMFDFIGWWYVTAADRQAMPLAATNTVVEELARFFLLGKSRGIFALMFGVAFFLQIQRARQRGARFEARMMYRMLILMLLGLAHAHLVYGGDILRYYAVGGLLLLVACRWQPRTQLAVGLALAVVVPTVFTAGGDVLGIRPFHRVVSYAEVGAGFQSNVLSNIFRINHETANWRYMPYFVFNFAIPVMGMLLVGMWLAGLGWLQAPAAHLPVLRRMCAWGIGAGFALQAGALLAARLGAEPGTGAWVPVLLARHGANVVLTLGYVAGICLLYRRAFWRRPLSLLAPAGRMTLTNYMMQSILAWLIFYGSGLGLYLQIGPALGLPIALALGALQLLVSHLWLKHFRNGPAESLWRVATSATWRPRQAASP